MGTNTDPMNTDPRALLASSDDSATSQEHLRILVVDDDETDRLAVRRCILQAGDLVRLDEAASGAETMEHVAAKTFDCILLDYYLPGENGLALLNAIHELAPETPVIIFTGRGDEEIAVELMKAGAADYLPKSSLTPARIASSLRHALAIAREAAERRRAEEELRAQEARFRRVIEIETVGILFFTTDGQITHANDALLRMVGYTHEDMLAGRLRWDELTPPEWMPRSLQAIEEYKATGRTTPYEMQYVRRDGSRCWALFAATQLSEHEGVEFVLDISERKHAEEELARLLASEHAARQEAEAAQRRLAMQYEVAALLAAAGPDEMPPILPVICRGTGLRWDLSALWQVDTEAGMLRCAEVFKAPGGTLDAFQAASREQLFKLGEGLVGRVWQRGESLWIADLAGEPGFTRARAARAAGLRSGVAVPLRVRDRVVGVLSVFSLARSEPDSETLSTLEAVGGQIGQFLERRRAEVILRRQAALLELTPAAVIVWDQQQRVTYWNQASEALYGWTSAEARGQVSHDLLGTRFPVSPEQFKAALTAEGSWEGELVRRRRDGTEIVVFSRWALLRDGHGRPTETLEVATDITIRKRVEAERALLLERERRARADAERSAERTAALQAVTAALVQALSPAEIAAVVTERGVVALRAAAAAAFVLNADAGVLEAIHATGYPEDTRSAFSRLPLSAHLPLTDALRSGEPAFYETPEAIRDAYPVLAEHVSADRYGSHALVPLILDGKALGGLRFSFAGARTFDSEDRALVVALGQQCAQALERVRLFAAEQAARAEAEAAVHTRDEFVALVSHDLRNPLTALLGQLQMLQRGAAGGKVLTAQQLSARLETMKRSVARLAAQIDELQDATHLQAGRSLEMHRHPTDLVALARETTRAYEHASALHSLRVETTVPELFGSWDSGRLERVVANLVSNAIKYSPSGGDIKVRVSRDGDWGVLTVEDHGLGIPTQDLPHIFERFRRASNVTQRITGTGLGLAGARDIVEQHGGSIVVQSHEGMGATFTVRLPCTAEQPNLR